ncbi:MAG: hypothetical protein Q8867_10490, partial [Bacteroidota bacterium]|nr:hypothetical protein [Bacteroidota bacterium]
METRHLHAFSGTGTLFFRFILWIFLIFGVPSVLSAQEATVQTDKTDYYPGETVIITGNNWQPGETVLLVIQHMVFASHPNDTLHVVAFSTGDILNAEYVINPFDIGETFLLTATGQSSNFLATTEFGDSPKLSSLTVGTQNGSICPGGSGSVTYVVTVTLGNNNQNLTVDLCVNNPPSGTSASFDPAVLNFSKNGTKTLSSTLTLTATIVPSQTTAFTVRAFLQGPATCTSTNGDFTEGNGTFTIQDNVPPTALCQNVTVFLDADGNGSTSALNVDNGSHDACGIKSLALSKTAFTCADIATNPNPVVLTVTDNNNNVATCNATVTVVDNAPPVPYCQNVTVFLDASGNGSTTAEAVNNGSHDACGIKSLALSKTAFTCADIATNPNPVVLTVTDNNNNVETCNATVTVVDNVPPVAYCQNVSVFLDADGNG